MGRVSLYLSLTEAFIHNTANDGFDCSMHSLTVQQNVPGRVAIAVLTFVQDYDIRNCFLLLKHYRFAITIKKIERDYEGEVQDHNGEGCHGNSLPHVLLAVLAQRGSKTTSRKTWDP